ncbi:hypothetical protein [Nocardia iowensis]|uniref:Lipoprotein n=1 Tax=Nocardia iowensis TaxID=204891 RepID=A0ABX8RP33_NOCIO|nr:hypothetical protein [Nocardia iowensis]QXN91348.1 hypothetical protein KV110_39585 [Nocardia iowensis]
MTRSVLLATAAATLAVALTACGGEGASDAAPSASSTVSTSARGTAPAPGTVEPTAETTAPAIKTTPPAAAEPEPATSAAPQTAPATAKPCAVVTREYLITTLRMTASPKYPLADLQNARCSGNYATALSQPEGTLHPVVYMFKYSAPEGWRLMGVDDAIDCVNRHGVPLEDARVIGCAL